LTTHSLKAPILFSTLEPEGEKLVSKPLRFQMQLVPLLLGADEGGLQLRRRDGEWLEVNPPPGGGAVQAELS
jgi:hypothetical protein